MDGMHNPIPPLAKYPYNPPPAPKGAVVLKTGL